VSDSHRKTWTAPLVTRFRDADEVWEHYQTRCSAEERARLRAFLDGFEDREDARDPVPMRRHG
jgi:hypothetical protein